MRNRLPVQGRKLCRSIFGFTLVELLIGIALASVLLAIALQVLARGRAALQTAENLAALEERAAFALTSLEQDLLLAGYWGLRTDDAPLSLAANLNVHCRGTDVTATVLTTLTITATDGHFSLPCRAATRAVTGTDTLTVQHVTATFATLEKDRVQLCATTTTGVLFQDGQRPATCAAEQPLHNVEIHSWYVDAASSEQNLPALYRYTLVAGGLLQNQEIMPGIEDLQVTLGVDRDGDNQIDGFVDPGVAPAARILAVRVWLLLRTAQPESGHTDNGPWYSIDNERSTPLRPADHFRRVSAERTIWLRNAKGA